jgi:hypothetical protein
MLRSLDDSDAKFPVLNLSSDIRIFDRSEVRLEYDLQGLVFLGERCIQFKGLALDLDSRLGIGYRICRIRTFRRFRFGTVGVRPLYLPQVAC